MPTFCKNCGEPVAFDNDKFFPSEDYARLVVTTARVARVAPDGILSPSHEATLVMPRHAVWVALRAMGLSYTQIGKLADRDHTTVMSAIRRAGPEITGLADRVMADLGWEAVR